MVAAGGVGVLVVIAFVAAIALGSRTASAGPGERVGVGRADAEGTLAVFVPRCDGDRVGAVEVGVEREAVLWRIESRKGSIDERYMVGAAPPPLGFETVVPLAAPLPLGTPLVAAVTVEGDDEAMGDQIAFTIEAVPAEGVVTARGETDLRTFQGRALAAAACPESRSELGLTTVVFGLGGLLVVASYGLMVSRWWRGRGTA